MWTCHATPICWPSPLAEPAALRAGARAPGLARRRWAPALWAGLLVWAGPAARAQMAVDPIVGRWVSVSGREQVEIKSNGYVRTCFVGSKPGSASMGLWTRLPAGNYRIEFSHAITPACGDGARLLRRYELSIIGNAQASRQELALYLSGEFPPDRFVRLTASAR